MTDNNKFLRQSLTLPAGTDVVQMTAAYAELDT
jgi:hypothetical protein